MFNFIICVQKCEPGVYPGYFPPEKIEVKNMLNLAPFWTTFQFDCKYLWNGYKYPKSEN